MAQSFQPVLEIFRGQVVESTHLGAIAVVDSNNTLLASFGDPHVITFLRSSAKPFQALPFVDQDGVHFFNLTEKELALACASHEGSDEHVHVVESIQSKVGIDESFLQCGAHWPGDVTAYKRLIRDGQQPTPNRNNCSGKHAAMLAYAKMRGLPLDNYLDIEHPIQEEIFATFAEMCMLPPNQVEHGIDGCSAPNFAVPLYHSALGIARLCDPQGINRKRAAACRTIAAAMHHHPEMISGPAEFDCRLMKTGSGKIICKRGAEGYQSIGLLPGALGPESPGIGIVIKIMDGDLGQRGPDLQPRARVRPSVALEVLKQLGALSEVQLQDLAEFGPVKPVTNHREIIVGESKPVFTLKMI